MLTANEVGLLLICGVVFFVYKCKMRLVAFWKCRNFWKDRGIPGPRSRPLFGSHPFTDPRCLMAKTHGYDLFREYNERYKNEPYYGTYAFMNYPVLIVRDLDLAKRIMFRDHEHFQDRQFFRTRFTAGNSETDRMYNQNMFVIPPTDWKYIRRLFTPVFSSAKLKVMSYLMHNCTGDFISDIGVHADSDTAFDALVSTKKFSLDIIASCAYGIEANSFKDEKSAFRLAVKDIMKIKMFGWHTVWNFMYLFPPLRYLIDLSGVQILRPESTGYILHQLKEVIKMRKSGVVERRDDMIDVMIDAVREEEKYQESVRRGENNNAVRPGSFDKDGKQRTTEEVEFLITATLFLMLLAGYETSGHTLAFCLWHLALNPDVQTRLREEILDAYHDQGKEIGDRLDFKKMNDLEYLDMVVHETVRMHPTVPVLWRVCTKEYHTTVRDRPLTVYKDEEVHIPTYTIHHDPQYYPDPERFDPERFSKEAKADRHIMEFLGFGQGPRNCIGLRFALIENKIALMKLLPLYEFVACDDTPRKVTLDPTDTVNINPIEKLKIKARRIAI